MSAKDNAWLSLKHTYQARQRCYYSYTTEQNPNSRHTDFPSKAAFACSVCLLFFQLQHGGNLGDGDKNNTAGTKGIPEELTQNHAMREPAQ